MNQTKKIIVIAGVIVLALFFFRSYKLNNPTLLMPTIMGGVTEEMRGGFAVENMAVDKSASRSLGMPIMPPSQPSGLADFEQVVQEDRLIIHTANFSIVSENVQASVDKLTNFATSSGGFTTNVSITDLENAPYAIVNFRVPAERFEETRQLVRSLGLKVVSEQVTGQDITEQYVDTEARLKNLRASEEQFLSIMKQATKVEDVLKVQQQLERVRGQIEQSQGRLQYLERSAKLATFIVTISSDEGDLPIIDPVDRWRPIVVAKEALRDLVKTFQGYGDKIIWAVIYAPIWLPILIVAYFIYRRINKA